MTSRNVRRTASIYGLKFERRNAKQVKIKNEYVCDGCGKTYLAFEKRDFCTSNCKMKSNFILNIENTKLDTNSVLGNSIIELKRSGLSHKQISLKLNCSKSTVSYYCNKNVSVKREIKISKNKLLEDSTYRFQKILHSFKTRGFNNCNKLISKD